VNHKGTVQHGRAGGSPAEDPAEDPVDAATGGSVNVSKASTMEPESCSNGDASPGGTRRAAANRPPDRVIGGRAQDRHVWAIAALVFPLLFSAIVGLGVYLMFHRNMGYFKPAPAGSIAPPIERFAATFSAAR
jgi:hypothetical protein